MTVPAAGMVPRPNATVIDRLAAIERRLRTMQQATAGATTAEGGVPLAGTYPAAIGRAAVVGSSATSAHADHVHTSTLAAQIDVALSSPVQGQSLIYSGSTWANLGVPFVVSALSQLTTPFVGEFAYCTTDGLLYKYGATGWVGVAALGPDSPSFPSAVQAHEARYRAITSATAQGPLSAGSTAVQFGSADYTSNDVSVSGTGNTVFTLVRGGLWTITACVRIADTTAGVTRYVQLTDSTFATVYQSQALPVANTSTVDMGLTCTMRLPASTSLSVNAVSSSTGSIDRSLATFAGRTSISLAWLRP
jgi:hypothetical protein